MAGSIATVTGTALRPGVSLNKRYYDASGNIARAVARAQQRLAGGGPPLTMRVSHPTDEPRAPVTEIVGQLARVWQETDGRVGYEATLADTPEARTVKALVDTRDGPAYVQGVSIRGSWVGPTRRVLIGGEYCETADDMEIDGLDFTHKPGVAGAGVETVTDVQHQPEESAPMRTPIFESVEEAMVTAPIVETAPVAPAEAAPTAAVTESYGDLGYRGDSVKRYPLGTAAEARKSWAQINEADEGRAYTAKQLKRVRERVVKALRGHGVEVDRGGFLVSRGPVTEATAVGGYDSPGSFGISLDNGMVCISVSSYRVDPHDLDMVARAAMQGACAALAAIDPDTDGDIDIPDGAVEAAPVVAPVVEAAPVPPAAVSAPEPVATPAPEPVAEPITESEAPVMTEPVTTPAVAAAPAVAPAGITLTDEQFQALLGRLAPPAPAAAPAEAAPAVVAEAAPAAPAAPVAVPAATPAPVATTPVTETQEQMIARLIAEGIKAGVTEVVQATVARTGPPIRKGLVGRVTESGAVATAGTGGETNDHGLPAEWPNKPLHEYKSDEERSLMSRALFDHIAGGTGR